MLQRVQRDDNLTPPSGPWRSSKFGMAPLANPPLPGEPPGAPASENGRNTGTNALVHIVTKRSLDRSEPLPSLTNPLRTGTEALHTTPGPQERHAGLWIERAALEAAAVCGKVAPQEEFHPPDHEPKGHKPYPNVGASCEAL